MEEVKKYVLENFREEPVVLIGCKSSKWHWPVCGYDLLIFTNNIIGYNSKKIGEDIVNTYYISYDSLEDRKNYMIWQKLVSGKILNDPKLTLTQFKEEALKRTGEIFRERFNEQMLTLLKCLAYCEEAYEHEAYASTAYWLTNIGYEAVKALNILNRTDTSPSHLIQQAKENPLLREPTYFIEISNFLGLEFATQTSYKRILSTLYLIQKFSEIYKFLQLSPTEGYKILFLLSDSKIEEINKKCEYAIKEHLQLNAHVTATAWFIETVSELYQTICSAENVPQYKPKIIEELESRRKFIGETYSFKSSILHEINPYTLKKNIEGARKLIFWIRKVHG
ncbi:MAG: hypothetical protein N3F64_06705 [Nitrososphaeria archaeon]|nr:hypothetical protein [Nitrososphaeria archaeon]